LGGGPSYEETAKKLGVTFDQVNYMIRKARKRFRELVKAEIAECVSDPILVGEEFETLSKAMQI